MMPEFPCNMCGKSAEFVLTFSDSYGNKWKYKDLCHDDLFQVLRKDGGMVSPLDEIEKTRRRDFKRQCCMRADVKAKLSEEEAKAVGL